MNFQDQVKARKIKCGNNVQESYEAAVALLTEMRIKRDSFGVTKGQRETIKSLGAALNYSPSRWDIHQRIENYAGKIKNFNGSNNNIEGSL